MLKVQTTEFHYICAVFGIFTTLLAFVSYLVKERLYISDSRKLPYYYIPVTRLLLLDLLTGTLC